MIENNNLYITPEQANKWREEHQYDWIIIDDKRFKRELLKKLDIIISLINNPPPDMSYEEFVKWKKGKL